MKKNNTAFLLPPYEVSKAIDQFHVRFRFLPKRLLNATITISSGERLPNAYKWNKVNNTFVTIIVKKGEYYIGDVSRKQTYKNSFPKNVVFSPDCEQEIKDLLFSRACDL